MHVCLCDIFVYASHLRTCTYMGLWCIGCVRAFVFLAGCRQTSRAKRSESGSKGSLESRPRFWTQTPRNLSPSAFHTLITRMFSLISLPVWTLSLSEVAPQVTDRHMAVAAFSAGQNLVTDIRCVTLTVGLVSLALLPVSVLHLNHVISNILDLFFATLVLSGGRDYSVCAETRSTLSAERLCVCVCVCVCSLWFQCVVKERLYASMHAWMLYVLDLI